MAEQFQAPDESLWAPDFESGNLQVVSTSYDGLTALELGTLQRVTEFVRGLTRSSGAAVAWGDSRRMVCVASSGASAPPIGTPIDPATGLARECIRSAEVASCVDASVDLRVSHEACEALGIASLLYLPIFGQQGKAVGLLGVFAESAFHFSNEHIEVLKQLLAKLDVLMAGEDFDRVIEEVAGEKCSEQAEFASGEQLQDQASPASRAEPYFATSSSSRSRIPLMTAAAVAMVIATGGWMSYRGSNRVQAKAAPAPAVVTTAPALVVEPKPVAPVSVAESRIKVVIDPGHGGRDMGTTSPTGLLEKDLTLDIAQRLGTLLQERLDCDVVFTRTEDKYVALETRASIANEAHADFLISIHGNSSSYEDVRGIETYYFRSTGEALAANESGPIASSVGEDTADAAKSFAADVQAALLTGLKEGKHMLRDRGVKPASFVVLREVQMPAVLAEVSFMSSSKDAERLDSADYRERVAEALYTGIAKHVSRKKPLNAMADLKQQKKVVDQ